MGNRSSATANSQTSTYYQGTGGSGSSGGSALNQYGSRGVPRVLDIAGLADSSATVTVNSQSTQRQGEHWFKQLALSGNSAQWQSVAVSISTGGSSSGSVLLKEHPEVYAYDDDGNLTSDGRWTYTWDAENRLRRMETASSAYTAGAPRKRIDYAYDDGGRRTLKSVYTWNTSTSAFNTTPAAKVGFLYHDWNLLQEVELTGSSPSTLKSFYWGQDMSGTLQGAGGVGGLLAADLAGTSIYYASDANGNVTDLAYVYGGFLGHYDYDAFGNAYPQDQNWNMVGLNPFRFSTKYTETDAATGGNETGLLYYGFRFYNPSVGRWPNRDPIEERGGVNLYGMVRNDPVSWIDHLGLQTLFSPAGAAAAAAAAEAVGPVGAGAATATATATAAGTGAASSAGTIGTSVAVGTGVGTAGRIIAITSDEAITDALADLVTRARKACKKNLDPCVNTGRKVYDGKQFLCIYECEDQEGRIGLWLTMVPQKEGGCPTTIDNPYNE